MPTSTMRSGLRRRLCLGAIALFLCTPIVIALAWLQRLWLLGILGRVGGGLDMAASGLEIEWAYVSRIENITVSLSELIVYSPGDSGGGIVTIQNMTITLLRRQRQSGFAFDGIASVDGLGFNFVAYDPLLADTNVRRLVRAIGGDESAAEGTLPLGTTSTTSSSLGTSSPSTSTSSSAAATSSTIAFTRVNCRRVSIHPSIRSSSHAGAPRVALPAVTLLDETLSMQMLESGLSTGMLNWLSSVVVRTLASTSIDTAASTLDGGVGLLASAIGTAIDLVDYTSKATHLPGASLLGGATRGTRRVVRGVNSAASAVLRGVTGGAKEVIGSKATPAGVLRGVERGVEALRIGLSDGATAALDGVEGGAASLVDGVEEFVSLSGSLGAVPGVGLLASAVHGVASAAKGGLRTATRSSSSVATGVLEGSASAIGGAAGGLSFVFAGVAEGTAHAFLGIGRGGLTIIEGVSEGFAGAAESAVRGDGTGLVLGGRRLVDGLLGGGWQAVQGMTSGSERVLKGTFGGVSYFGRGLATGAGAVVTGVMEPTEQAARDVRGLLWGSGRPREVCTSHSVYQRTLGLRTLGLRRRGKKQEVVVCTSA